MRVKNGAIEITPIVAPVDLTNLLFNDTLNTLKWNGSTILTAANLSTQIIFSADIIVSLTGGKTLGRYTNGQTIPANGKTAQQVIELLAQEPIPPTLTLTSPTTIQFNQTAISNVLNFTKVINSLGATVSIAVLEWRRNNSGSWTTLTSNTADVTYTHNMTDTNFNAQVFNYRYTVTDSIGGTNTITLNITPTAYVAPSITFSAPAASITTPETNTSREKGNISSNLQGSTSRNSPLVNILSYQYAYSLNGGAYVNIGSSITSPANTGGTFTTTNNNDIALIGANSITYKVTVTDDFGSSTNATYTINFTNIIFYGPSASVPVNSSDVRALGSRRFTTASNVFNLNTGTTQINFTVAMPSSLTLSSVIDLDALNAVITSSYILNTFNVNDAGTVATAYKIYTMSIAIPYSTDHRHQITF